MLILTDSTDTQQQFIHAFQAGESEAYGQLYDKYAGMLYGIILRIVNDETEAENLLQDCFLKIWQNAAKYDPSKGKLATWLINIARNTAIDFTRSKYFHQKLKNQNVENYVGHEKEPVALQSGIETLGIRQLVEKLSPVCREVIEWMYFEGYTQQEIAENFGIPLGTVKSRTRLALRELRAYFGPL